jgi:CRISPR-associated protein Cas6
MNCVDLVFRAFACGPFPSEHRYALFGAMSKKIQLLHESPKIGIGSLGGDPFGPGLILLNGSSIVRIRTPAEWIGQLLPLSGTSLTVLDRRLRLGTPQVFALTPHSRLKSRLVTIKGFMERDVFEGAVVRQLYELGIERSASVLIGIRRVVRIHQKTIIGFSLEIEGLNESDSIKLQEHGIGGRRHFDCGLFLPVRTQQPVHAGQEKEAAHG